MDNLLSIHLSCRARQWAAFPEMCNPQAEEGTGTEENERKMVTRVSCNADQQASRVPL